MNNNLFTNKFLEKFNQQTPFFVFSKDKIINNLNEYKKLFPNSLIHYAMKANTEKEVLEIIFNEGGNFEVASKFELEMLKEIGVPGERIIYGTSVKPIDHIKDFYEYGARIFSFDSYSELEKIAIHAPNSKVHVRIAVNDHGSVFKFSEKFGTEKTNIVPLLTRAKELGLIPYGISFHVGSQASNVHAWANGIKDIKEYIYELQDLGIVLEAINIGGGFPCKNYLTNEPLPTLSEISESIYEEVNNLPYELKIILEPGRGIVADTAVIVASVIGRVERRELNWLFLDVGVYSGLFESMSYQGGTRYKITPMRHSLEGDESAFAIAGPTGDSPDIITREVFLPDDINVGDKLIIHDVGAYSLPAICPFNGFPKPPVYYV